MKASRKAQISKWTTPSTPTEAKETKKKESNRSHRNRHNPKTKMHLRNPKFHRNHGFNDRSINPFHNKDADRMGQHHSRTNMEEFSDQGQEGSYLRDDNEDEEDDGLVRHRLSISPRHHTFNWRLRRISAFPNLRIRRSRSPLPIVISWYSAFGCLAQTQ